MTWSYFLLLHSSLTAALRTDCSQSRRYLGAPTSRLLLRSTCDVTKAATAALAASKGRDLMQPLRRRSWRKQRLTVRATWSFIDRSDCSMTPRSRTTFTGRIKKPQTLSSPVSRWEHRLLVAHQRSSVFSELRQSLLDRIHSAICSTPSSILRRCNPSDEGWPHVYSCESSAQK